MKIPLKRRLWLTFVLPAFLAALIIRIVQTLVRLSLLPPEARTPQPCGSRPKPVPIALPKASVKRVPVETITRTS